MGVAVDPIELSPEDREKIKAELDEFMYNDQPLLLLPLGDTFPTIYDPQDLIVRFDRLSPDQTRRLLAGETIQVSATVERAEAEEDEFPVITGPHYSIKECPICKAKIQSGGMVEHVIGCTYMDQPC